MKGMAWRHARAVQVIQPWAAAASHVPLASAQSVVSSSQHGCTLASQHKNNFPIAAGAIRRTNTEARERAGANVRTAPPPPPPAPGRRHGCLLDATADAASRLF